MSVFLIGDPGSCHLGELKRAKELIHAGAEAGLDAVKFQLFDRSPGNIPLPPRWVPELVEIGKRCGVEVFFSIFPEGNTQVLRMIAQVKKARCKSIKIAFSQRSYAYAHQLAKKFTNVYISTDCMTELPESTESYIRLYCIPQYPVPFIVDFEGVFPRFDGFSDHTLGVKQTLRAIGAGAQIIEKHYRLGDAQEAIVPDGRFAVTPKDIEEIRRSI